ncbi:hypothetical protein ACIBFB_26530 [Nocardiopsis sp. NPDC050513]|uniref:hypothetical protein n=1 Tax=Nocardiopsis sp. NPDC050513 TaxID=3364338 RepID=UPI0037991DF2
MRLTHRRRRAGLLVDHLADAARRLTDRVEDLTETAQDTANDLRAAEHTIAEIRAAYTVPGYVDEATLPEDLRMIVRRALAADAALDAPAA